MTNDPPDLPRPCSMCGLGYMLPEVLACPNPCCSLNPGPEMAVSDALPEPRWPEGSTTDVELASPDVTRYRARRVVHPAGRHGWAWGRESQVVGMTTDAAVQVILTGPAQWRHAGRMCAPGIDCGTCSGLRVLLSRLRAKRVGDV